MKRNQVKINDQVVVSDAPDATIYEVTDISQNDVEITEMFSSKNITRRPSARIVDASLLQLASIDQQLNWSQQ